MQRAKLIVSFPRQRGKEPDRLPIHVIAVEKLLIGRISKCHSGRGRHFMSHIEILTTASFVTHSLRIQ